MSQNLNESMEPTPHRIALLPKMRRRLRKIIRECEQMIIDYEYWQSLPHNIEHAGSIDIEWERVTLVESREQLAQVERIMKKWNLL